MDIKGWATRKVNHSLDRDRLLTLVNNLADPIISTDKNGIIQIHNAASLNLLDTNTELNGQAIDDVLVLSDSNDQRIKLLPLMKQSHTVTVNDTFQSVIAGETVRLEITYSPIRDGYSDHDGKDGYVVIIRDITKAKSLEEERDEFISVVSHELRTPIAIAEGAIDNSRLIFERTPEKKDAVKSALITAHEQVIFLSKMVNDLSTLSRAERGVADAPELIDVDELAHNLYREYSPEAEKKGLHLNLKLHGKIGNVSASRLYLHELLQNFITNAIKYTPKGHVDLAIEKKGNEVVFSVTDSGIGISRSDQAKIFQKFYRAEDYRTRETSGTGLGLYVSMKLSKKLGCTIMVKSRLNHGSTFWFTLPLATSDKEPTVKT